MQQSLGDDEHALRRGTHRAEQLAAGEAVGEVDAQGLVDAAGALAGQDRLLVVEHVGEVDVDPAERGRQLQPPGTRVETGGEVEDGVDRRRRGCGGG